MTTDANQRPARGPNPWRIAAWSLAGLLLLLPLAAMQFTNEVDWSPGDFIFAGLMIGVVGLVFELTVRVTRNWWHRAGVGMALAAAFLTIWANGAVGMIGNEDNPYNLLFLAVILLALTGAILARFRPKGMAIAMAAAALAQAAFGIIGAFTDLRGGIFATMFAGLWILAAALLHQAARGD